MDFFGLWSVGHPVCFLRLHVVGNVHQTGEVSVGTWKSPATGNTDGREYLGLSQGRGFKIGTSDKQQGQRGTTAKSWETYLALT